MKTFSANHIIIPAIVLLLASCQMLPFDRMPGTMHNRIPWKLRGEYRMTENKKTGEHVTVSLDEYKIIFRGTALHDSGKIDTMRLNQDFLLSEFHSNWYAFGTRDTLENDSVVVNLHVIRDRGKRLHVYNINASGYRNSAERIFLTRDTAHLKTYLMDDAAFYHFCRRELKRKDAGFLLRMK
jgi:hypothetical protein